MTFRKIIPAIPAHRCEPAHRGVPAHRGGTVTTRPAPAGGSVVIVRPARRVIGG
ncbi:hypothetical protein [Streptomyces natalensis]|uniref:hypothetical protein n=1 Tax=Streptomyces natalensis TaxID=68242 RepID=UPI000A8FB665|nr:hypothetical protein [Streptomyces natalensis]